MPPDAPGFPFVRTVVERDVLDSTSNLARRLVESGGIELPMLVRAATQTAGRGRGDRSWWSDEGSLTFTVALDPEAHGLRREHEPRVALTMALVVLDAFAPYLPPGAGGIRWPNDVEVAGRKLGGILPERVETPEGPRLLIGIGLNLTTRLHEAPAPVRAMATSLEQERADGSPEIQPESVLRAILSRLATALSDLARDDPALPERWSAVDTLLGRELRVQLGPEIFQGRGAGITTEGALRAVADNGTVRIFHGGTVLRDNINNH